MTHPLYSTIPEELELHRCKTAVAVLRETGLLFPVEISKNSKINEESGYKESHSDSIQLYSYKSQAVTDTHVHMSINTLTTFTSHV